MYDCPSGIAFAVMSCWPKEHTSRHLLHSILVFRNTPVLSCWYRKHRTHTLFTVLEWPHWIGTLYLRSDVIDGKSHLKRCSRYALLYNKWLFVSSLINCTAFNWLQPEVVCDYLKLSDSPKISWWHIQISLALCTDSSEFGTWYNHFLRNFHRNYNPKLQRS